MVINRKLLARNVTIIILLTFCLLPGLLRANDIVKKIDALLNNYYQNGQLNGSVLVARSGEVIYKNGFGFANLEWMIPNTPDTKFRLASVTKQFTAMLIMQLVEEGKLKLDGRLSDYLPDYRSDVGGKVTIHHLLLHTSGIRLYTCLHVFM